MATDAFGRQPLTIGLPHSADPVARIAVHCSVGPDQWKAILMFVDGMNRDLPATDPVAEVALRPVLPPVQVGMAVLAVGADVGEYRIIVAVLARHPQMQAPQGITSLAVIKLRLVADWCPCRGCVTLLARNLHGAMGTSRRRGRDSLLRGQHAGPNLEYQERVYEKQIARQTLSLDRSAEISAPVS
jgi:hypothetical protein